MKTSAIAASAIVALLVLGGATVAFAHADFGLGAGTSSTQSTHSSTSTTQTGEHDHDNETGNQNVQGQKGGEDDQDEGGHFSLTAGTSITFTNLMGHWVAFGSMSGHSGDRGDDEDGFFKIGNSTGAFTFKVTSAAGGDFNLTITSGKFTINGTTYTVSHGTLALNEGREVGTGIGTASGGATFEIHLAGIHGNLTSSAKVGAIRLDVTVGKSMYLVVLGSGGVGEDVGED